MAKISIVVAMALNRVIGNKGELPWHLPADLKHFKELTTGHFVIMGRKTFESILRRLGNPLPDRRNVVITENRGYIASGCTVVHSFREAYCLTTNLTDRKEEVFVIGGEKIYRLTFPQAERIYLTLVEAHPEGDAFFPEIDLQKWPMISAQHHEPDEKNKYPFTFMTLERLRCCPRALI
ncbi:MAG: dihydrofolate reductase [Candidatus Wolfebacteria bacterium]|nr:dihydrofolate reductase [Candidatus Wolfebacteria bacterium]